MATKKHVVKGEQDSAFYSRKFELERQWRARVLDPKIVLSVLQALNEPGNEITVVKNTVKSDWLADILNRERQAHLTFFGREFDLTEFEKILRKYGRKKVKFWQKLGMEPHFLPKASMMAGDDYAGWKIKPEQWFYKQQIEGKLLRSVSGELKKVMTCELEGITVLIDTRLKPAHDNGKQMWANDNLLGEIVEDLRRTSKMAGYEYGPQSSRFGVSANEWEVIKPFLAAKLGLSVEQVRLETTIERSAIPQIYSHMPRKDDGNTDTSVWVEEYFGGRGARLHGGHSGVGGLARVHCHSSGGHWSGRSFRPLAVLSLEN